MVGFAACSAVSDLMASTHRTALWRLQPAPPAPLLHARLPCSWLDTRLQGGPAAAQRPSPALPTPSVLAPSGGETRLCTLGCGFFAPFLTPRPVWAAPVLLLLSCSSCLCLFQFFLKRISSILCTLITILFSDKTCQGTLCFPPRPRLTEGDCGDRGAYLNNSQAVTAVPGMERALWE